MVQTSDLLQKCKETYFANEVASSPVKASSAPPTAVFLQPKWSVNMLTTGEQKKIMPMARAPTQAREEKEHVVRNSSFIFHDHEVIHSLMLEFKGAQKNSSENPGSVENKAPFGPYSEKKTC